MSALTTAAADAAAASPEAWSWVKMYAADNDAEIVFDADAVNPAAEFMAKVVWAHRTNCLVVVNRTPAAYVPPTGAELTLIKGAVRRGFALKHGRAFWLGYCEAGNGTPAYVWPATAEEYYSVIRFARAAKRN
jgi:hypothetical protein